MLSKEGLLLPEERDCLLPESGFSKRVVGVCSLSFVSDYCGAHGYTPHFEPAFLRPMQFGAIRTNSVQLVIFLSLPLYIYIMSILVTQLSHQS